MKAVKLLENRVFLQVCKARDRWGLRGRVFIFSVGRPGLDPGTLGLKGTFQSLFRVGLVAYDFSFQGIVLSYFGLV